MTGLWWAMVSKMPFRQVHEISTHQIRECNSQIIKAWCIVSYSCERTFWGQLDHLSFKPLNVGYLQVQTFASQILKRLCHELLSRFSSANQGQMIKACSGTRQTVFTSLNTYSRNGVHLHCLGNILLEQLSAVKYWTTTCLELCLDACWCHPMAPMIGDGANILVHDPLGHTVTERQQPGQEICSWFETGQRTSRNSFRQQQPDTILPWSPAKDSQKQILTQPRVLLNLSKQISTHKSDGCSERLSLLSGISNTIYRTSLCLQNSLCTGSHSVHYSLNSTLYLSVYIRHVNGHTWHVVHQ